MTGLALLAALLAPIWDVGAGLGGGVVADEPVVRTDLWVGLAVGEFALALQAPLRWTVTDEAHLLRERDWDERADFGRVLRFARYGDTLAVGALGDLTLGHGTLVRRYHNGVDDDHHRVGVRLAERFGAVAAEAFADQVLAAPVVGARVSWGFAPDWRLGATFAGDAAAPQTLDGGVDDTGRLTGTTTFLPAYGADVEYAPHRDVALYVDVNRVDASDPGLHLGVEATWPTGAWRLGGRLEGMYLGEGYDWAYFDTGYLIDRWLPKAPRVASLDAAWGGRGGVSVGYADALLVGAEYGDAGAGRAELSAWLRVPTERLHVSAFGRNRYRKARGDLLDPSEALAALAARAHVGGPLWGTLTVARVWRVDEAEGWAPFTEASLMFEAAWRP
ncbi:MAG: hypothetical protein H6704_13775 [Myxococcales bacterium]|nr:hypothetical protein [Myxococcales bacterium]